MKKENEPLFTLNGNIRGINLFCLGSVQYVIQIEINTEEQDKTGGRVLSICFEKHFKDKNEHRRFYDRFRLEDKVIIEGNLDENLKFEAKNILLTSEAK